MNILEKYTDEELCGNPYHLTKTQVYKLRKGVMQLSDIRHDLEKLLLERYNVFGTKTARPDYNNPDYSDPSFIPYDITFRKRVKEVGLKTAYTQFTQASACGCMGSRNGAPFCPCQMNSLIAKRYASMQIFPTEEGEMLLENIKTE